jgi:hypothetical protein
MSTSRPASMPCTAMSACIWVGRQMSTRCTSSSEMTLSRLVVVANPNWSRIAASFSDVRPKTITSVTERELERRAQRRLAVLRHVEEVSFNVAASCRYYGISRQCYYGCLAAMKPPVWTG